eukprot:scaffold7039_cov255-Pinguiococcus_pyrenoidosus.AAC.8
MTRVAGGHSLLGQPYPRDLPQEKTSMSVPVRPGEMDVEEKEKGAGPSRVQRLGECQGRVEDSSRTSRRPPFRRCSGVYTYRD